MLKKISELEKAAVYNSNKLDEVLQKCSEMEGKIKQLTKSGSQLKENLRMQARINEMNNKILDNKDEIVDVPEVANEKVPELVREICSDWMPKC